MNRWKNLPTCLLLVIIISVIMSCKEEHSTLDVEVYETSAAGNNLTRVTPFEVKDSTTVITINDSITYQKITGFGGAFTESSAYLLNRLSKK
ncbi:glycosyl hydrolase [Nonlabens ulvanivorans]|nr:glycosyl hydrolase [Nonlabens ulvanivorans]